MALRVSVVKVNQFSLFFLFRKKSTKTVDFKQKYFKTYLKMHIIQHKILKFISKMHNIILFNPFFI